MRRFLSKIAKQGDCWVWTGTANSKGYPYLRVGSAMIGAHVVAHELFVGRVERGDQVHHECLNRLCVCPTHLHPLPPPINRRLQSLGVGDPAMCDVPF